MALPQPGLGARGTTQPMPKSRHAWLLRLSEHCCQISENSAFLLKSSGSDKKFAYKKRKILSQLADFSYEMAEKSAYDLATVSQKLTQNWPTNP